MPKGFAGKVLHVNLTDGTFEIEHPTDTWYRCYFGGNGFIAYYLLNEIPKGADPLGPDNVLVFAMGTMTGIPVPGAGRSSVGAKSPLSGGYASSEAGGFVGAELKMAGFDALVIKGKADKPVYLWIHDGEYELRPAEHMWGMTTGDFQAAARQEVGERLARTAAIGPGGEKMVRFACVMHDLVHSAGRTGTGAVMGSKMLKGVVVRARNRVEVADTDGVRALGKMMRDTWKDKSWGQHDLGTPGGVPHLSAVGSLPTRNFQSGQFEGAETISGQYLKDTILTDREGCYACPIQCKRVVGYEDKEFKIDPQYGGPEYETIGSFGSNCGVDDLRAISKANEYCNATSVDTISCGMAVSFAMECWQHGILTAKDTGGLDLSWGNGPDMAELTRQICYKDTPLGSLLAEGPTRAAEKLGGDAWQYVVDCKKQPFPMHMPRTRHGQGLGFALSPTGADHMHSMWDEGYANDPVSDGNQAVGIYEAVPTTVLNETKVRAYKMSSTWQWVQNHLGNCMFVRWSRDELIELVRSITGWQTNMYEMLKAAERGVTLARVFNLREGLSRADDKLPLRMQQEYVSGSVRDKPIDPEALDDAVTMFYQMMGWDPESGVPSEGKLRELDLSWANEHIDRS